MNRRMFLLMIPFLMGSRPRKHYNFYIETKNKSRLTVPIQGWDVDNAKSKLNKRYPDCKIISTKEK